MSTAITSSLPKTLTKYYAIAQVNWKNSQAFFINTLARSLIIALRVAIFYQMYTVTFQANNLTHVNNLDVNMVVWTLLFAQSLQSSTRPPAANIIQEEVQNGSLSYTLNRPYSFILFHLFGRLGTTVFNALVNLIIAMIVAIIIVGLPHSLTPGGILAGITLALGGFILDFLMNVIIGLCAFWLEDIRALNWMYSKGQLVLGGLLIPPVLFPDWLRVIVEKLPFPFLFAGAAQQVVYFQIDTYYRFLTVQIFWILFFAIASKMLFSYAIKHVSHNGG